MNVPRISSGIHQSILLRNAGNKEIFKDLDNALGGSIAPIVNYNFVGGMAKNPDGSHPGQISNCQYHSEWDSVSNVMELGNDGSCIRIPALDRLAYMPVFGVEMKVWPRRNAAEGKRMNLLEGQSTPFALMVRKAHRTHLPGEYRLSASVNLDTGWQVVEVPAAHEPNINGWYEKRHSLVASSFQPERWTTVGMVYTGSDLYLFISGTVVARGIFKQSIRPIQVATRDYFVGTWVDGRSHPFEGMIGAVRIWDTIPYQYLPTIEAVETKGWWEIPNKYIELGGEQGFLGSPIDREEKARVLKNTSGRLRQYRGGTLFWSPKTGTYEVHGAIGAKNGRGIFWLGFPRTDEVDGAVSGVRLNLFENGAIYWSARTGACAIAGPIYAKYSSLGGERGFLGLPLTYSYNECVLEHGRIYYLDELGAAFEVHGAILAKYLEHGSLQRLGHPTSDESVVLDDQGQDSGARLSTFERGAIYWSSTTGAVAIFGRLYDEYIRSGGPAGELGLPIRDSHYHPAGYDGSDHQDFENGVIIVNTDGVEKLARLFTELELHIQESVSGEIDDGYYVVPPSEDRTPELFANVQAFVTESDPSTGDTISTRVLDAGTRFPADGNAGDRLVFERRYRIKPMRYYMDFHLHVDFWDHDEMSSDDHLGSLDHTINHVDAWGILREEQGIFQVPLTDINPDHTPAPETIFTTFAVREPAHIDPSRPFREQCFWPFDNFTTDPLNYQLYANTFKDVELEGWMRRPIDHLLYSLIFKHVAAKGNCFGMCLEAMYALANRSLYACPLEKYQAYGGKVKIKTNADLPGILAGQINSKQCYQWSASSVSWFLSRLRTLDAIRPLAVYDRVKSQLDRHGFPIIVSMIDIGSSRGHAVLVYGWSEAHGIRRLLIADPNFPYCADYSNSNLSYIQVFDDDTFQHWGYLNHASDYHSERLLGPLLPGTLMFDIPYPVLAAEPDTPSWLIYLGLTALLGGLILIVGDAESRQISAGEGRNLYRYLDGKRRIVADGVPGMVRIPAINPAINGLGPEGELYAQRGDLPEKLMIELEGKKKGSYDQLLEAPLGSCRVQVPVEVGDVDTLEYDGADSGPPSLSIAITAAAKQAQVSYSVYGEPLEKMRTTFELGLNLSQGMRAVIGFDRRAQALLVAPAGPLAPLKVTMETEREGQKTRSSLTLHSSSADESFKIYPTVGANGRHRVIVEGFTLVDGKLEGRRWLPRLVGNH